MSGIFSRNTSVPVGILDVRDGAAVRRVVQEEMPDCVIHLAYLMDPQHNASLEKAVDVQGSINVFSAANEVPSVRQLLLFSSTSAYGAHPDNPLFIEEDRPLAPLDYVYGIHKKTVEEHYRTAPRRKELRVVIFRMCTAVGPSYYKKGGVVAGLSRAPFVPMIDGCDLLCQWIHEDDVKKLTELVVNDREAEGVFNLVPDSYTTTSEMARSLEKRTLKIPGWLFLTIIHILWFLRLSTTSPPMVRLMKYGITASPDKIKKRYGYSFARSSLEAFLDAVEKRRANGTL